MVYKEKQHDICKKRSQLLTLASRKKQTVMDATFTDALASLNCMLPVWAFES
jgi:hypothetical protein